MSQISAGNDTGDDGLSGCFFLRIVQCKFARTISQRPFIERLARVVVGAVDAGMVSFS
jgi:hypothetical protein